MVEFKEPLDLVRVIVLDGRLQHHRLAAQVVDGRGQAVKRDKKREIERERKVRSVERKMGVQIILKVYYTKLKIRQEIQYSTKIK